jgi:phage terminase small subunit
VHCSKEPHYGHSVYNPAKWKDGAEEAWKNVVETYEKTKAFENEDPWFKD